MVIAEILMIVSSITIQDTTIVPSKEKNLIPVAIKTDTLKKKTNGTPLDSVKAKAENNSLLRKIKRGGWDGN